MGVRHPRVMDLFCGAGGSSIGAWLAGAKPVAAVDAWDVAASTYQLNFPGATVFNSRLENLRPSRLKERIGRIDLLLASPECTNHSVAKGKAPRCEKSRNTAFQVIRFARAFEPRWIVVENVANMRNWRRFDEWHAALLKLGYHTKILVLDSSHYGVPQSRKRLFVVCDRKTPPALLKPDRIRVVPVRTVLSRNGWKFSPLMQEGRAADTLRRAKRAMKALGADVPFLLVYYGSDKAGGFQALDRPLRTITTLDRFALVRPSSGGHEMRMLQPPELMAAMGFPSHYKWPDISRRERIKLIGNAVCPPVMKYIVEDLLHSDGGVQAHTSRRRVA